MLRDRHVTTAFNHQAQSEPDLFRHHHLNAADFSVQKQRDGRLVGQDRAAADGKAQVAQSARNRVEVQQHAMRPLGIISAPGKVQAGLYRATTCAAPIDLETEGSIRLGTRRCPGRITGGAYEVRSVVAMI